MAEIDTPEEVKKNLGISDREEVREKARTRLQAFAESLKGLESIRWVELQNFFGW